MRFLERLSALLPKSIPRWQRMAGYTLFGVLSFILSLFLTFPHQAFWAQVRENAGQAGYLLRVDDYGAGPSGITAYGVKVSKRPTGNETEAPPALELDALTLRPMLLPPGLAFRVKGFGGKITGSIEGFSLLKLSAAPPQGKKEDDIAGDADISFTLDGVDLSRGNLKAFSGVDLSGQLDGTVDFKVPIAGIPGARMYVMDLSKASGKVVLNGGSLMINGGTVTVPMMGEPVPMDLPKVNLGKLDGLLRFDKGAGTVETFRLKSEELEAQASGTVKLAKKLEYSEPAVDLKIKLEQALMTRLGAVAAGLTMLPPDPENPDFRVARWSGFFNRPRFGPPR